MKKILLLFAILLFNIGLFAQNQRYYEVRNYIISLGYSIDENANVWHQNLTEKDQFYNYKNYIYGNEYILVAFSQDTDVLDVDLWLCNPDGTIFKKDTDTKNIAVLFFTPAENYYMKTYVQNYSSLYPSYPSTCWLIVGYK
jgi:hypothetical protein